MFVGLTACLAWLSVGCASSGPAAIDAGGDAGPNAVADASSDATAVADSGVDAGLDAAADVAIDAVGDAGPNAVADASSDATPPSPKIVVMTYNVMCSFCSYDQHSDWVTDWDTRVGWIRDVIKRHNPDLMGIEELNTVDTAHRDQVDAIGDPKVYGSIFYHHKPGDSLQYDYPDATIYYRLNRFTVKDHGVFWLGLHPDTAFDPGFAQHPAFPRLVIWALLRDRVTGKAFYFAATHFDNNAPNQDKSAPLVLQRFAPKAAAHPFIFSGDFNSSPDTTAYGILTKGVDGTGFHFNDTFDQSTITPHVDSNSTPAPVFKPSQRIDHVFVAGGTFTVFDWVIDMWHYGDKGQTPSDHDGAIFVTLTLP